ncbi:MAG: D-aminoacyl-tRNA deacylase [Actinomycetota bacterium]
MRLVLQRVASASVTIDGEVVGSIGSGLLALVGVGRHDTAETARVAALKAARMRIFPDEAGRMNRSLIEAGGAVLVVSQFTLLGDTSRGRRPSFAQSAPGVVAESLVGAVADELRALGIPVEQGRFGANMQVLLLNDGPVTMVVDI